MVATIEVGPGHVGDCGVGHGGRLLPVGSVEHVPQAVRHALLHLEPLIELFKLDDQEHTGQIGINNAAVLGGEMKQTPLPVRKTFK